MRTEIPELATATRITADRRPVGRGSFTELLPCGTRARLVEESEAGLGPGAALLWGMGAVTAFRLAYGVAELRSVIVIFVFCLGRLFRLQSMRWAFRAGLVIGLACYAPHLGFFWTIFGPAAGALWLVLAVWLGVFLVLGRGLRAQWGGVAAAVLLPFLWTGLEYFRSELYYLRFSWLSVGYAFAEPDGSRAWAPWGVYGMGFVVAALAGCALLLEEWSRKPVGRGLSGRRVAIGCLGLATIFLGIVLGRSVSTSPSTASANGVRVVGVQLEYPDDALLLARLELAAREHPLAELVVLSEYTLPGPPTGELRSWCRRHGRHLVVGGRDPVSDAQFHNTVFVVDPQGEIVFRQVKSVPIQFFQDGLPARSQSLWHSPWGLIGFAVCYDLSYRRVMDRLVRQGAEAVIVPTADDSSWGEYEHRLHARVALVRAAEYGIPILRVAGSGISQLVDGTGRLLVSAPYPGQGETLTGELPVGVRGRVPFDSWLAPASTGVAGFVSLLLVVGGIRARGRRALRKGEG